MSSVCMRDLEILKVFQWYYNAEQSPWEKALTKKCTHSDMYISEKGGH